MSQFDLECQALVYLPPCKHTGARAFFISSRSLHFSTSLQSQETAPESRQAPDSPVAGLRDLSTHPGTYVWTAQCRWLHPKQHPSPCRWLPEHLSAPEQSQTGLLKITPRAVAEPLTDASPLRCVEGLSTCGYLKHGGKFGV